MGAGHETLIENGRMNQSQDGKKTETSINSLPPFGMAGRVESEDRRESKAEEGATQDHLHVAQWRWDRSSTS